MWKQNTKELFKQKLFFHGSKHIKLRGKLERVLAIVMMLVLVVTGNHFIAFAEEPTAGIYGDFYVTDESGQPISDGSGVFFDEADGILTVTISACKVTMRPGVTTTEDRIVFDCSGNGSQHSYLYLENIIIQTSKGIAFQNKRGFADEIILGDCVLIGTIGVKIDSAGGNMSVGSDSKAASVLMQGTTDYGFRCDSTIGFYNNGNMVTIIGSASAVSVGNTTYLNTEYSEMKAGEDQNNLIAVSGFAEVNNKSAFKYVTISPDSGHFTTCNITFDANGGTGTMNGSTVISGRSFTIPICTFIKDGSTFQGWVDGEGNTYQSGDVIDNVTDDVTLSATWSGESASITSVSVTPFTHSVIKGNSVIFSATVEGENNPEQTVSWSVENATSTGTTISDSGELTVDADENATQLIVKATSTVDTTKSGTATVQVEDHTYTIQANLVSKDFGSQNAGYTTLPTKETITITNTGNSTVTLTQPTASNYQIEALLATKLEAGESTDFTIQPKSGLASGIYSEEIIVETDHNTSTTLEVTFQVNGEFLIDITPTSAILIEGSSQELEAMPDGGSGSYTYLWYEGTSDTAFSTEKEITVSPTVTTTYRLVANDSIEDKAASMTVTVNAAAPTGLTPIKPSDTQATDGKITGTTAQMEYSTTTGFTPATTVACTGTQIIGLSAGTYYIRVKEGSGLGASAYTTVVVPEGEHTFTNYTYNNDATYFADGTETGSCICGETHTKVAVGTKKIDNTSPNVTLTIKNRSWTNILNVFTFGNFFKETQEIQITALDYESGLDRIQYYVYDTPLTEDEIRSLGADKWITYNKDSRPTLAKGKYYVYAKATDQVGNKTYVGTDNIVIYQDSTQNTSQLSFIKNVSDDVMTEVSLNGNTIDNIRLGSDTQLSQETDYIADNQTGRITFKKSYLNKLAPGSYIVRIGYKPQGEKYQSNIEGNIDKNEVPDESIIEFIIRKPKLTSITAPAAITQLQNGTAKTAQALGLPDKVSIQTEDVGITKATVIWNLDTLANGSYDPNVRTKQTFTISGKIQLPDSIDANGKHLITSIQVTVNEAKKVEAPTANPKAGTYTKNQKVELTSATKGAIIYYTTDGSTPSKINGTKYTGKIKVNGKRGKKKVITIQAIAVNEKMQDSLVATFTYVIKVPAKKSSNTITDGTDYEDILQDKGTSASSIITEPNDSTVFVGEEAIFTVEAKDESSYQWQVDCNDGKGFVNIADAIKNSYTVSKVDMSYNGFKYRCVVTNEKVVEISDVVSLTVQSEADTTKPSYIITAGADEIYTLDKEGTITITCSGDLDKLIGIYVDDNLLDTMQYLVKEGSSILTLKSDYLNTLEAGTHTLKFVYNDGSAETTFTIKEPDLQTDESNKGTTTTTDKVNEKPLIQETKELAAKSNTPSAWPIIVIILSGVGVLYFGYKKKIVKK